MSEQAPALPKEDPSLYFAPQTIRNVVLTWLVPGLGYWLLGRKKAAIIMTSILYGGFLLAVILGGDLYPFSGEGFIRRIGSVCQLGMGLPYLLAQLSMDRGTPLSLTYDYGTNYFLITGMINWLATFDVFDISVKRK